MYHTNKHFSFKAPCVKAEIHDEFNYTKKIIQEISIYIKHNAHTKKKLYRNVMESYLEGKMSR